MHDQRGDATMPTAPAASSGEPTSLAAYRENRIKGQVSHFGDLDMQQLFKLAATNDFALAALRDRRFEERAAQIKNNATMDELLKAKLLDRTILNVSEQREQAGFNQARHTHLRKGRTSDGRPHPSGFPDRDIRISVRGHIEEGVEAGRLLEWQLHSGRVVWDPVAKKVLKPKRAPRHGRPPRASAA